MIGVDINPAYLTETARRYAHLPLELHCVDLATHDLSGIEPVHLVHAALVLEHAGTQRCVENAVRLLRLDGHLSVVLQLASAVSSDVSPSRFESIQQLRDDFSLVDPSVLIRVLSAKDLRLVAESTLLTRGGKSLWLGIFQRPLP